jgi:sortase A
VKDLRDGDEVIFTTKYGTRTYEVFDRKQITDADFSYLGWSDENIITIVTCVENTPGMRWCVRARERR